MIGLRSSTSFGVPCLINTSTAARSSLLFVLCKYNYSGDNVGKNRGPKSTHERRISSAAAGPGSNEIDQIMAKYSANGEGSRRSDKERFAIKQRLVSADKAGAVYGNETGMGNGVFAMLLLNFVLHGIAYFWSPPWIQSLALSHWHPKPWQFVTAAFVHANWEHLFGNAFSLLVFGRMVEEEEGALGLWLTYLVCGVSGNVASYISSPGSASLSLGASSAVFGLFIVGVLTKMRPSIKRLMEAAILGSYVVKQVLQEVHIVASGKSMAAGGMSVGHWAHLGGAAAGVVLVLLLSRLPPVD